MHVYIDGESHFIRSEAAVKEVFGEGETLESIAEKSKGLSEEDGWRVLCERQCKFFWDCKAITYDPKGRGRIKTAVRRFVYFTSFSGDDDALHSLKVTLREKGFEPRIVKEPSQLAKQRENVLRNCREIEKPKGVDIALAVRMLEDAQHNVFDECCLLTSDVDYISVIEAVQRMGKLVYVYGYRNGIGKNSKMEYVPDAFVDLAECMKRRKGKLALLKEGKEG